IPFLVVEHLPLSPAIISRLLGRLVAGDTNPGRHVVRDKLKGKARQGYFPERLGGARIVSVILLSATALVTLFELFDIGRVDSGLRRGQTSICGASRQYPTNTGKVPPLLALSNDGHDLFFGVEHTRLGVGA
ncbi:hypothetical protein Tco_1498601, partial [Tanacetum coccineum]